MPQNKTQLSQHSVYGYITALIDLYQTQKAMGINSHQSLQKDNIREYLKVLQQKDMQQEKEQFVDKDRDTLLDRYTENKFKSIYHKLQAHRDSLPECYFYILVDILLDHYILTHSSNRRFAEISDLFIFKFKREGPTHCMPLIFTIYTGKQNQHGCLKTIKALYNKKPLICMLSRLAFYLLYCWDLSNKLFPDFSKQSV